MGTITESFNNVRSGRMPWDDGIAQARQFTLGREFKDGTTEVLVLRPGVSGKMDRLLIDSERLGEELGARKNEVSGQQAWKTLEADFKKELPKLFADYQDIAVRINRKGDMRQSFANSNTSISELISQFFLATNNKSQQAHGTAADIDASGLRARAAYFLGRSEMLQSANISEPAAGPYPQMINKAAQPDEGQKLSAADPLAVHFNVETVKLPKVTVPESSIPAPPEGTVRFVMPGLENK